MKRKFTISAVRLHCLPQVSQRRRTRSYTMKTLYQSLLVLIGTLAVAGTVYGQCTSGTNGNTCYGEDALYHNDSGIFNTAFGFETDFYNFDGSNNTATGTYALFYNVDGNDDTATGYGALYGNSSGGSASNSTATGYEALYSIISGNDNTASGDQALYSDTTGGNNTASGYEALYGNTSGSNNIAEGWRAGYDLTTGSSNIDIGNPGAAGDNAKIKIGVQGTQTATYIAGIYGHSLTGSEVVVTSKGELGVLASSERFKTDIAPMGSDTAKLGQLRPVTFKLKSDATGTRQYGLIAEEVANVYPELVIRDEKGQIDGVRYEELAPMLLNEVQKQAAEIRDLKEQQKQSVAQAEQLRDLQQQLAELHAALAKLQSKNELVAQR